MTLYGIRSAIQVHLIILSMSFFKHVQLHKYDLTNKGISQACYDEMRGEGLDLMLNEDEMRHLADFKREAFKNFMRPLFQ